MLRNVLLLLPWVNRVFGGEVMEHVVDKSSVVSPPSPAPLSELYKGKRLTKKQILLLLETVTEVFKEEPNVVEVNYPVNVCGDLHGQFEDLLEMFKVGGYVPNTNYLFLGDYVDRGMKGLEIIFLLFALKVKYRSRITILRGNHESKNMSSKCGFHDECRIKYWRIYPKLWSKIMEAFYCMPVAAVVGSKVFCVHGGVPRSAETLDEIRKLDRMADPDKNKIIEELLWSDPVEDAEGFSKSPRGIGNLFGPDATKKFLEENNLKLVCRAHQFFLKGYQWNHNNQVVTIFSAPNYCYKHVNPGTYLELDEDLLQIRTFLASPETEEICRILTKEDYSEMTKLRLSMSMSEDELDKKLMEYQFFNAP